MSLISWIKGFFHSDGIVERELYELFLRKPLSAYILPAMYDEEVPCYLMRDNTIGFAFECFPKPLAGADTVKVLQALYSAMYLPEGTTIQVTLYGSDYLNPFIDSFQALRGTNNKHEDTVSTWIDSYIEFAKRLRRQGPFPEVPVPLRNYRLFFSFKLPIGIEYNSKIQDIQAIYRNIKTSLESAYFFPTDITPQFLIHIYQLIFNPNHNESYPRYDPNEYIYKQIILAEIDTAVKKDYIEYDGVYGKALTIKQFPDEVAIMDTFTFIGDFMRNELQIICPFLLTLNIIKLGDKLKHQQEHKAEFLYKQKLASSMSVKLERKQDESKWMIEKMIEGNRLLRAYPVWWLYHQDIDVVRKSVEIVKNLLDIKNYTLQEELKTVNLLHFLYSIAPLSLSNEIEERLLHRARTMFDFNAANLSPVQSDWKGTGTPVVKFISRRGQDISFNFFDGSEGFNGIIAAQTGSGKSFVTNHIIYSYYSLPSTSNIWVIDIGESYKSLAEELNGVYLDFREDMEFVINPFSECDDLSLDMDLFIALISKMAKPTENVTDTEKSVIEEAIRSAFNNYEKKTNIDKIIESLEAIAKATTEYPKRDAATVIATNLYRWSTSGVYGKYFNGKNNIDLQHKLVVLELKNVSQQEDLRNVILMVLFYHISKVIYMDDDRSKRKLLIFDEAWQFFDDAKIAKFIERAYRTFRKYGASAITVTQGINDFYTNDSMKETMFQASYWLLLKQKPEAINLLKKEERISLSEHEFSVLESVRTIKGKYSEIFFVTPLGRGVGRLIVPRHLYWIYTTDPDDVVKRKSMTEKYGFREGITKCVEIFG